MAKTKKTTTAKRHEKAAKKLPGIRKTRVRRLAHRGGVSRMADSTLEVTRTEMTDHLRDIIGEAFVHMEYRRTGAKRIRAADVEKALERHGEKVFGVEK
jgi:hypothetical protein